MRHSFEIEDGLNDDTRLKLENKLALIGGVLNVKINENKIDIIFKKDEDDVESIIDIIDSFGLRISDNESIFPDISLTEVISSIIAFVLIRLFNNEIFQTFLLLIILLVISNKILIYSFNMLKKKYITNALVMIIIGFVGVFKGMSDYLFPQEENDFVVIASFLLTSSVLYHYLLNKRIASCSFYDRKASLLTQAFLLMISVSFVYFNNLSVLLAVNFDMCLIRLRKISFLCFFTLFICAILRVFPYYYYIIPSGIIVIFGSKKE